MRAVPPYELRLRGVPQAPLSTAVESGCFGMSCSDHEQDSFTWTRLHELPRPWLITVVANQLPGRTASAVNLRRWAAYTIVHAVEPITAHYTEIAALVPVHERLLLVETTASHAAAWVWFLSEKPSRNFMAGEP